MLSNRNPIRVGLAWLSTWNWFERTVISLILFNSLLLGIKDYQDPQNLTIRNKVVEAFEPVFMWAFLAECVIKILAMGFLLDKRAYLSEAWNWLDFIVVVSSLLANLPFMSNFSGLRTFRLFRPLRSLQSLK